MGILSLNDWKKHRTFTDLEIKLYIIAYNREYSKSLKIKDILQKFGISLTKLNVLIIEINQSFEEGLFEFDEEETEISFNHMTNEEYSFFNDSRFQEVWIEFMGIRKIKKTSQSPRAINDLLKKIREYSNGDTDKAIEIVTRSADCGWKGVFPLRDDNNKTSIAKNQTAFIKRTWNANDK